MEMAAPKHLGVIPDGNRRWAREHGFPTLEGHRRGMKIAKQTALAAFDRGIEYFTLYGFSTENWRRSQEEVGYLMELFYGLLSREYAEFEQRQVRFCLIGDYDKLPAKLQNVAAKLEARTSGFTKGTLALCLNYGGETEIATAMQEIANERTAEITPELIAAHLYHPHIPPLDLVIRTSGERRLSGFMLWRSAYAELYFVDKHWPDFTAQDLDAALEDYAARQRRFGA